MSIALVWFRQDLRCHDNPALAEACHNYESILPVYIYNPEFAGNAQDWWIHHSLQALEKQLKKYYLSLCLQKGNAEEILKKLVQHYKIDAVYWNKAYDPDSIKMEKSLEQFFHEASIEVHSFNANLLNEPWGVKNKSGHYFKVFTPYWKQAQKQVTIPHSLRLQKKTQSIKATSDTLEQWKLLPQKPNWAKKFSDYWEPGELGAQKKLKDFINNNLNDYNSARDEPAQTGTSHLSPHLHFGEISPFEIWRAVQEAMHHPKCDLRSAERFLSELGWREFCSHLLYYFPELPKSNFREDFDHFPWHKNNKWLKSWQQGMTGYPIVDAGMRQLWQSGFMHNRVRMITASFLIKDLSIDWRDGADWFLHTLLDADLANNSSGWQWVAGSGADATPYFRIFNPVLQGEKFDPQGDYVKFWVPELAQVPAKWIHKPWEAPSDQLGIILGKDYPKPLVDHKEARKIALQNYKNIKKK